MQFSVETGNMIRTLNNKKRYRCVSVSVDGTWCIAGGEKGVLERWNLQDTASKPLTLKGHTCVDYKIGMVLQDIT